MISDFFSLIGNAVFSFFIPTTMLALLLLVSWPTLAGTLSVYDNTSKMQQSCALKVESYEISQCYQRSLNKIEAKQKVTTEYTKNVALPYYGVSQ